jgi:small subunit ribosomal protein S16
MALKIRLRRMGRKKAPHYRIVVAESSMPRDGRFVAKVGHYNPTTKPTTLVVDRDRVLEWMAKGARPTETVANLFRKAGVNTGDPTRVEMFSSAAKRAAGAVAAAAASAAGAAKSAAGTVAERAKDAAETVTESAKDAAVAVSESAKDAVEAVTETVQDAAEAVAERVAGTDEAAAAEETPAADEAPAAEATEPTEAAAAPEADDAGKQG